MVRLHRNPLASRLASDGCSVRLRTNLSRQTKDLSKQRARLLQENYPSVASELLRPLLSVFSTAREICDGDLDKYLILLALAMRVSQHPEFKTLDHDRIMAGEPAVLPSLGANIRSIAVSIGIPKETARRKMVELVNAGWLVRQRWDFRLTAVCYAALEPVQMRIRAMAVANDELLARLPD